MNTKRKKKQTRAERQKRRAERADLYNEAFTHGYEVGFKQGQQAAIEQANKQITKAQWWGR